MNHMRPNHPSAFPYIPEHVECIDRTLNRTQDNIQDCCSCCFCCCRGGCERNDRYKIKASFHIIQIKLCVCVRVRERARARNGNDSEFFRHA